MTVRNEYLEKFLAVNVGLMDDLGYVPCQPDRLVESVRARHEMVLDYAWAVPHDGALDALVRLSPIVEIGAGGGYWAALLRARGADVLAFDEAPPGSGKPNDQARLLWTEVAQGNSATSRLHADRTLFLCWPPYDTPMAFSALYGYLGRGGKTLAFIGEQHGGCTGNSDFFDLLDERMEEVDTWALHQWPGVHDYLTIYTRKE